MSNPAAWEILMDYIYPIACADSFSMDLDDHVDDEMPAQAWEWDMI